MDFSEEYSSDDSLELNDSNNSPYRRTSKRGREELIQMFLSEHLDTILDMYYDIEDRFKMNPLFLGNMKSTDLTAFFIQTIFYDRKNKRNSHDLEWVALMGYYTDFMNEIYTSHVIINSFLSRFDIMCPLREWIEFCTKFSILENKIGR